MISLEFLMLLGLLGLRLGLPILATVTLVWVLHRLDLRWQHAGTSALVSTGAKPTSTAQPDCVPLIGPCWLFKGCPEEKRNKCFVYRSQAQSCWLAHLNRDGRLPNCCRTCGLFAATSLSPAAGRYANSPRATA